LSHEANFLQKSEKLMKKYGRHKKGYGKSQGVKG